MLLAICAGVVVELWIGAVAEFTGKKKYVVVVVEVYSSVVISRSRWLWIPAPSVVKMDAALMLSSVRAFRIPWKVDYAVL